MAFSAQSLPLSHKRAVQKNKTVKLNPNISRIKNSAFFRIWGFAPSPHQRAFRSPFGNLRAQILRIILEILVCQLDIPFLYKTKTQSPIELRFDFEKIKIPKCRCRRFSPTARGRSVPCGAFLPSPGVLRRGRDIHEPTRSSCYENVGENTDDWRTPQDI